jgi:hypothetical protein
MDVPYLAPTMFRGRAMMTRKRGLVVDANAGRGKLGAREQIRFYLLTCLPLRKGIAFKFSGRIIASGPVTVVQRSDGSLLHMTVRPSVMKDPY